MLRRRFPLARKAVELARNRYLLDNTLGLALYRNGQPDQAIPVLELSLQKGGGQTDAFDLFALAMCHHQLGHAEKAKQCYAQGVHWFTEHRKSLPANYVEDLNVLQQEADALLKK